MFDSTSGRVLRLPVCAVPAARSRCIGGFVAHAWLARPCTTGAGRCCPAGWERRHVIEIISRDRSAQPGRSRDPGSVLDRVLGDHPFQDDFRIGRVARQTATFLDVFRRSRSSPRSRPSARRCPPSPLVGVFQAGYAEINAQFRIDRVRTRPIRPAPPARPMLKSLDGRRPRAHPRGHDRGQQARAAADVPRHDGERDAVHRPVRHGRGAS